MRCFKGVNRVEDDRLVDGWVVRGTWGSRECKVV